MANKIMLEIENDSLQTWYHYHFENSTLRVTRGKSFRDELSRRVKRVSELIALTNSFEMIEYMDGRYWREND